MKHSLTIAPSAAMQTFEYIEANKNNLHEWMPNGFCRWCHDTHRSDFRPNYVCGFEREEKNLTAAADAVL